MASFARIALTLLIFWTEKCMSQTQNNNPSRITVSKEKITLTANATTPGTDVTVTCQPPLSGVEGVTAMNIKRRAIGTPAGSESILVSAISYKINGEAQLIDKTLMAATVSGSLTTQTISLMMTQAKCSDEGTYVCVVAYGDSAGNAITATSSKDLIAEVGPGQVTMTYSDRPYGREAWMVNDTLTLTCQAPVGTVNTTASTPDPQVTWVWQYKNADGEYPGSIGYWQTFIPASPDTITTGNFIADNTLSCNNYKRQTSTLQRYLELADSGRMYRCLVRRGGADYEQFAGIYTVSDVTEDGQTSPATDASEPSSAGAGAIVGGVIGALVVIAVIIIIIYFLVIRPRRQRDREYTDGSTEKGGNKDAAPPYTVSADPAPVYSQPVKRSSKTKDTDTALQEITESMSSVSELSQSESFLTGDTE